MTKRQAPANQLTKNLQQSLSLMGTRRARAATQTDQNQA